MLTREHDTILLVSIFICERKKYLFCLWFVEDGTSRTISLSANGNATFASPFVLTRPPLVFSKDLLWKFFTARIAQP